MPGQSKPVVGLVCDLDDALFDFSITDQAKMFIPPEEWLAMLSRVRDFADVNGVQLEFGIITSKGGPDDITASAATTFKDFLYCHDRETKQSTPYLHNMPQRDDRSVKRYYACMNRSHLLSVHDTTDSRPDDLILVNSWFTNFHITQTGKDHSLIEFADEWQAKRENIVFFDDTDEHLESAEAAGFTCISAAEISKEQNEIAKLYRAKTLLRTIEDELIKRIKSANPKPSSKPKINLFPHLTSAGTFSWSGGIWGAEEKNPSGANENCENHCTGASGAWFGAGR